MLASSAGRSCGELASVVMWRCLLDPEAVEQPIVAAPAAADAHGQVEVHVRAELALELAPRGGADRLDHPALRADQDPLLRLGLDPRERLHAREVVALVVDLLHVD